MNFKLMVQSLCSLWYKDKFCFEDGKIVIKSQKDVEELVEMLNDSIVKSELTGTEYNRINKSMLPPL